LPARWLVEGLAGSLVAVVVCVPGGEASYVEQSQIRDCRFDGHDPFAAGLLAWPGQGQGDCDRDCPCADHGYFYGDPCDGDDTSAHGDVFVWAGDKHTLAAGYPVAHPCAYGDQAFGNANADAASHTRDT
jgi:hypothetical protein